MRATRAEGRVSRHVRAPRGTEGIPVRPWRRVVAACVGILAALVLSTSALGASPWLTIREQGVGALSVHSACTDNGDGTMACESELLQVLVGKLKVSGSRTEHTDEVCYGRVTATVTSDG